MIVHDLTNELWSRGRKKYKGPLKGPVRLSMVSEITFDVGNFSSKGYIMVQ